MRRQRSLFRLLRSNSAFQITNCKIRKKYGFDKFAKKGGILTHGAHCHGNVQLSGSFVRGQIEVIQHQKT